MYISPLPRRTRATERRSLAKKALLCTHRKNDKNCWRGSQVRMVLKHIKTLQGKASRLN